MGECGNIFVRRGGAVELFCDPWIGDGLPWLLRGPEAYERAVRDAADPGGDLDPLISRCDEPYDDVMCEAAVLVDHDAGLLLVWLHTEGFEVPLVQRRFVELARAAWPAWKVRWASHGLVDVMEAAGWEMGSLPDRFFGNWDLESIRWLKPAERGCVSGVVTVRRGGRQRHVPVQESPSHCDLNASNLMEWLESWRRAMCERLDLYDEDPSVFEGGAVVDLDEQVVAFWSGCPARHRALDERWPGWRVTWWGDRSERHLEEAGGSLRFPALSESSLREAVDRVCRERTRVMSRDPDPRVHVWASASDRLNASEIAPEMLATGESLPTVEFVAFQDARARGADGGASGWLWLVW